MGQAAANQVRRSNSCSAFDDAEFAELEAIAQLYIDSDTLFMKAVNFAGSLAESGISRIPAALKARLDDAVNAALRHAYSGARRTQAADTGTSALDKTLAFVSGDAVHVAGTAVTGAIGGAFGALGTLIELPASTMLIFRSIQQIAADYGEDIDDPEVRAHCIGVFALGGPLADDDGIESGLFATRMSLATQVTASKIADFVQTQFFKQIAQRYGIVITEKMIAAAPPILGAVAGSTINAILTNYYQKMAHIHFRLRRLEFRHEADQVKSCFGRVVRTMREAAKPTRPAAAE